MDEMNNQIPATEEAVAPLTDATPREIADAIAEFIDNKRGRDVKVIPMDQCFVS